MSLFYLHLSVSPSMCSSILFCLLLYLCLCVSVHFFILILFVCVSIHVYVYLFFFCLCFYPCVHLFSFTCFYVSIHVYVLFYFFMLVFLCICPSILPFQPILNYFLLMLHSLHNFPLMISLYSCLFLVMPSLSLFLSYSNTSAFILHSSITF